MTRKLNLVRTESAPRMCGLMEEYEDSLAFGCTLSRTLYSRDRLLSWLLDIDLPDTEDFEQIEIIFDPENIYSASQGMHIIMSTVDQLHAHVEGARRDGFARIYIHLNFRGAK